MPLSLVISGAARLRLLWASGGSLYAINVIGVVNPGSIAITQAIANTLDSAVKASFASSGLNAQISPNVSLVSVAIRSLHAANQPEFVGNGAAAAGAAATQTDMLPPQTALVITLRTLLAGKRYRGRVFLPGYCENVNSLGGVITSTTASVNFVTAIKANLVTSSLDMGVIHIEPAAAGATNLSGFITPVSAIVARDSVWDTQRRRAIPGV